LLVTLNIVVDDLIDVVGAFGHLDYLFNIFLNNPNDFYIDVESFDPTLRRFCLRRDGHIIEVDAAGSTGDHRVMPRSISARWFATWYGVAMASGIAVASTGRSPQGSAGRFRRGGRRTSQTRRQYAGISIRRDSRRSNRTTVDTTCSVHRSDGTTP
jgi:hypothetical protein